VAVLIGGIILYFFDFPIIDPLLSVGITCYVLYNVVRNLRESMKILLQGTPANLNPKDVQARLEQVPEISSVHDLHIWTLDGTYNVLTLHAVIDNTDLQLQQAEAVKQRVRAAMAGMDISHVTVELEVPGQDCSRHNCDEAI